MPQEIINRILAIQTRILTTASRVAQYDSWSPAFGKKECKHACSPNKDFGFSEIELLHIEDLQKLTQEQLHSLGFRKWGEEIILIPLYLKNFIFPNEVVMSISGEDSTIGKCGKDARGGCIAYGFTL